METLQFSDRQDSVRFTRIGTRMATWVIGPCLKRRGSSTWSASSSFRQEESRSISMWSRHFHFRDTRSASRLAYLRFATSVPKPSPGPNSTNPDITFCLRRWAYDNLRADFIHSHHVLEHTVQRGDHGPKWRICCSGVCTMLHSFPAIIPSLGIN